MDINKVKNYNQKLLALFGTLAVILIVVAILGVIVEFIANNRIFSRNTQGLLADDKVENLNQENLRQQIISYESPWLVDTLQSVYIIPVTIKTLKKPENTNRNTYAALQQEDIDDVSLSSMKRDKGYQSYKTFSGNYANLIVYNPMTETVKPIFDKRVFIGKVDAYYFKDDILLVFYTAEKDIDENGVIDLQDARNLSIYSMNTEALTNINDGDNTIYSSVFIENSKDLLIEFTLSQYKNNQFDAYQSPRKIMRYSYDSHKLTNIIPDQIQAAIQKLVEGK